MFNRNATKSNAAISALKQEFGQPADVSVILMDLSALDSVRQAANDVLDNVPKIGALICNGAIAQVAKQTFTKEGFESQLGVNHFGHFLLCGILFERLEACQGRIVVVDSNAFKMGLKKSSLTTLTLIRNTLHGIPTRKVS